MIAPQANRTLWLIDAGYMRAAQEAMEPGYRLDYVKLRDYVEASIGQLNKVYYLDAVQDELSAGLAAFHSVLESSRPKGPGFALKLYPLKSRHAPMLFCKQCGRTVQGMCPDDVPSRPWHDVVLVKQTGVDVGLATLALTLQAEYDILVLSTGDEDFLDPVEYLAKSGKEIVLLVFSYGVSAELQNFATQVHWINRFRNNVKHIWTDS